MIRDADRVVAGFCRGAGRRERVGNAAGSLALSRDAGGQGRSARFSESKVNDNGQDGIIPRARQW